MLTAIRKYDIRIVGMANELIQWANNERFIMEDMIVTLGNTVGKTTLQSINREQLFFEVDTRLGLQLACGWRCNKNVDGDATKVFFNG